MSMRYFHGITSVCSNRRSGGCAGPCGAASTDAGSTCPARADTCGFGFRRRAEALISIAHPNMRGDLRRALAETRHF
jgi:hypothetical protein